jgi:hypothetical protein
MTETHTETLRRLRTELERDLRNLEMLLRGRHPAEAVRQQQEKLAGTRQQVMRVASSATSPDVRRDAEALAAAGQDRYARLMKGDFGA